MKPRYFILLLFVYCCTPPEKRSESITLIDIESPANTASSLPHLIKGDDGILYLSWVEELDSSQVVFKYSALQHDTWSVPEVIASGDNWFVNWADYPMLAIDTHGNKLAHFLAKSADDTYAYDVNMVIKPKDSIQWSSPIIPHKDNTPTEHGFVSMLPHKDATGFTIAWLDGRNTLSNNEHEHGKHQHKGAMTLRTAVIDLHGNISNEALLDNRICDCCQTGGVMTPQGSLFVYRDRSVDEVRDIAFISKKVSWSDSKMVSNDLWTIAGCPVNGPRVATFGNTVGVAWFTGAFDQPKVKVAFKTSDDFGEPFEIDNTSPIGRVDIVMINKETAIVSWMDSDDDGATIKIRSVSIHGSMSPSYIVSKISEKRASGFPQMEAYNDSLYFAFTIPQKGIRLTSIPVNKVFPK